MSATYPFNDIESKWQQVWEERRAFRAANPGEPGSEKAKFYVLDFFPYPSGAGLHVGHPLGYIASDIIARYKRMRGFNVLHPMGWDAFGLPAEQYAVETGVHPAITTRKNIDTYKRQLRMIGLGYDWEREIATCEPDYYRWTQWIFLQIYNSWYDPEWSWTDRSGRRVVGAARPIETLPIPQDVREHGELAIAEYQAEHRLAYQAEVPVNWCPALGTVLANEEVTNEGRSERGNHPVYRRPMKQWMLRITEYADRLLADLEELAWPEPIKLMQRNWIGRSEGAYVDFMLDANDPADRHVIRVFTTRPDTLFGATYLVLAPEHWLVPSITTVEQRDVVDAYVREAAGKSELDRTAESKKKTGVFTGAYAVNPVNHERIPIWVADYVLAGYGTGSIMAVPGSDKRDLEFAETFGLPVRQVVEPPHADDPWRGFEGPGRAVNSPAHEGERFAGQCELNGLPTAEAKRKIVQWLEERDLGEGTVQYKLRDWLFSRQRYWGEPFPVLHAHDGRSVGVAADELPVALPEMDDFRPSASSDPNAEPQTPLSRAGNWADVTRDGQHYRREVNTMPQWAGSCWYYLRFCDAHNDGAFVGAAAESYWLGGREADGRPRVGGVDLYMGGAEHAVLHLLYARFWHKVLYDLGHVHTPEPFHQLFNQGMIQSYAFQREDGVVVPRDRVLALRGADAAGATIAAGTADEALSDAIAQRWTQGGRAVSERVARQLAETNAALIDAETGGAVSEIVAKMSKSLKNVVNPDAIIGEYGADTLRLYEMYMGPLEASKPWNTRDIIGVHRFLQRVWRLVVQPTDADDETAGTRLSDKLVDDGPEGLERLLHKTIQKVQGDIERFAFNTAIAQMIVWVNEAAKAPAVGRGQVARFLRVLFPFAPHVAEELWQRLGHDDLVCFADWPDFDPALAKDDVVEIAVQIKGKLRGRISVPPEAAEAEVVSAARELPAIAEALAAGSPKRVIYVPGRLLNLII